MLSAQDVTKEPRTKYRLLTEFYLAQHVPSKAQERFYSINQFTPFHLPLSISDHTLFLFDHRQIT
jgi:hypothetical protein